MQGTDQACVYVDVRGAVGSLKHVRNFYAYGGKLFLKSKLEWFKSKQMSRWKCTVFICSQGPYRALNSDRNLATIFCIQSRSFSP